MVAFGDENLRQDNAFMFLAPSDANAHDGVERCTALATVATRHGPSRVASHGHEATVDGRDAHEELDELHAHGCQLLERGGAGGQMFGYGERDGHHLTQTIGGREGIGFLEAFEQGG
jgi:hypothetical protein